METPVEQLDILERNVSVNMVTDELEACSRPSPVPGYSVRPYRSGDENLWVSVQAAADRYNEITLELFRREFGDDEKVLAQRQFFLEDREGEAIGTAAAWWDDDYRGRPMGRVHWVAVVPSHQGRGLSKPLLGEVCQRLCELGHHQAYLVTSTARVPAINLYLKFGFRPDIRSPEDRTVWQELEPHLKWPDNLPRTWQDH